MGRKGFSSVAVRGGGAQLSRCIQRRLSLPPLVPRVTPFCPAHSGPDHRLTGDYWQGPVWRSVARPLAGRRRGCENILFSGGTVLVPGSRDLPDSHASP